MYGGLSDYWPNAGAWPAFGLAAGQLLHAKGDGQGLPRRAAAPRLR